MRIQAPGDPGKAGQARSLPLRVRQANDDRPEARRRSRFVLYARKQS